MRDLEKLATFADDMRDRFRREAEVEQKKDRKARARGKAEAFEMVLAELKKIGIEP